MKFFPAHFACLFVVLVFSGGLGPKQAVAQDKVATPPAASPPNTKRPQELRGRVIDGAQKPLIGATVTIVETGTTVFAEADGKFEVALPPGSYTLRVEYPDFRAKPLPPVVIVAGQPATTTIVMLPATATKKTAGEAQPGQATNEPAAPEPEAVVVIGRLKPKSEAGMLQLRQRAASVTDSLSSQEMSRNGDSSASAAVARVVSVTVTNGRYVMLRGLGDRYVSTLLNGVTLPSPEPDKQAVPLDLFPTSLLSNLIVGKSYDPKNPGIFGGGTLAIETDSYPDEFAATVKLSVGSNSAATFQDAPSYGGGSLDFLGFDDGGRALPNSVPTDRPARLGSDGMTEASLEEIGESFGGQWSTEQRAALPNASLGISVGDTTLVNGRQLGYLATLSYGHRYTRQDADIAKVRNPQSGLEYREQMRSERGSEVARVGGLVSLGYQLAPNHRVNLFSLYTHTGENAATRVAGFSETDSLPIDATRLRFIERSLSFTQLQTEHRLGDKRAVELQWQANVAVTSRDEPDTRDLTYQVIGERYRYKNETGSGERFHSELSQLSLGTGLSVEAPLTSRLRIAAGSLIDYSMRDFSARRFRYEFMGNDPAGLFRDADELDTLFTPESIGTDFRLQERTLPEDAYDASLAILAAYTTLDYQVSSELQLYGGMRYERSMQALDSGSPYAIGGPSAGDNVDRTDDSFLPGVSARYALTQSTNLRAAYSYTLARPRFREVAPFRFYDYTRRRNVSGNPDLLLTRVHNADLRTEHFFGDRDVLAASVFYKRFVDPIEQVIVSSSNGDVSFANAARADAYGAELEARIGFSHLHPALRNFRGWANLSLIQSSIELRDDQIMSQTNANRPMQGQSPFVVNLGLSFATENTEAVAQYNVFGRRIAEVGFQTLPDVYEQPINRLDISMSHRLRDDARIKLNVRNALNASRVLKQGDLTVFDFKPGVTVALGLEWTP